MKSSKQSKVWRDGYASGIEKGRELQRFIDRDTIHKLKAALDKAMMENLQLRDAVKP